MTATDASPERQEWKQARRAAFVQDVVDTIRQRSTSLLSFEEAQDKLRLGPVRYLGVQTVPLDQVVGSVERYHDFNRAFLPRQDHLQERWQQIERLVTSGHDLPPIELYKVGQAYFVRDGNHRVSVARRHGRTSLPAHVWDYDTPVPLRPGTGIDELLGQTARAAFLERTQIDRLCPEVEIRLSEGIGYEDLLDELEGFQQIVSQIDQQPVPFDETVVLWCALRYTPVIEIIRQQHVLADFPGRTEADLYLWLRRHLAELDTRYERPVSVVEAAGTLAQRAGETPFSTRPVQAWLERTTGAAVSRAADTWDALKRTLARRR